METKPIKSPRVLVLGATGMLGRIVYGCLKKEIDSVWGTSRQKDLFLPFEVGNAEKSIVAIRKKLGRIDYVINCIGLLQSYHFGGKQPSKEDYLRINAHLPLALDALTEQYAFRLIHISTNAVLNLNAKVNERTPAFPQSIYGMSKFLGEPEGKHCLTIRSSFIGCDPNERKGLVELVRGGGKVGGYTNQKFSGCTTLQLARLLREMIIHNRFDGLRKLSPVLHFVPIKGISKYQLLGEISKLVPGGAKVVPSKSKLPTTQVFASLFDKQLKISQYTRPLAHTLAEMLEYEKEIQKNESK